MNSTSSKKFIALSSLAVVATITACYLVLNTEQLTSQRALSQDSQLQTVQTLFDQWKITNNKVYSTLAEEEHRFSIFVENYKYIQQHNAKYKSVQFGLTKFTDLTKEEFRARYLTSKPELKTPSAVEYTGNPNITGPLPTTWDWRDQGVVTPVEDEKECGACYAFSVVNTIESLNAIKNKNLIVLSKQQPIDCSKADDGCNGGYPTDVFNYSAHYGLENATAYPYKGETDKCAYNQSEAVIYNTGYSSVPTKSPNLFQAAVYELPINADMNGNKLQFYTSGVITEDCSDDINFTVEVVGWTEVDETPAWICRVMFGLDWGVDGYVFIGTNNTVNSGAGLCGIYSGPTFPIDA